VWLIWINEMTSALTSVLPISPPAAYIGGKRVLSKTIIELINKTPHSGYAEAFVGIGSGVFEA
jgi:DNA adenine methylase